MPRISVPPGDFPLTVAARRIGLTVPQFEERKHALFDRGFPRPDPTTGLYDLDAVDRWRKLRNRHLYPEISGGLTSEPKARDAGDVVQERLKRLANG